MRGGNPHLLAVPLVVQDHILSYLTLSEQLQVRHACKTTKDWIDRSRFRLAEHIPFSTLREHGSASFANFFSRRVPLMISSFYLENSSLAVFEDSSYLSEFLSRYSKSVTSLRIKRYFVCRGNEKQNDFYDALSSIKYLEVDEIWIANADDIATRIPETFRGLVSLKFGHVKVYDEATYSVLEKFENIPIERKKTLRWHVWNILDVGEQLKHLRVPISPKTLFDNSFDECFRLLNFVRIRTRGITEGSLRTQPYVMQCDLENFNCCTSSLEVLLIVGSRMKIQFQNVNSKIFKRGSSFSVVGIPNRGRFDYIQSFVSSSLVNRSFDFVQKLTLKASLIQNECILGREKGPTLFPNLKEFHMVIDIGFDVLYPTAVYSRSVVNDVGGTQLRNVCFPRVDQVLRFFFPEDTPYRFVHTLSIGFYEPAFPQQKRARADKLETLPTIINCLPCLKHLTIKGWNCKRKFYLDIWNGFPGLVKLIIDGCTTLSPSCFIAGNGSPNNPANFSLLPVLEYIELRGLDQMSGVINSSGQKDEMKEMFAKFGFVQFDYLCRDDVNPSHPRTVVWIRPSPSRRPGVSPSTIVTRSVSKYIQSIPKSRKRKRE